MRAKGNAFGFPMLPALASLVAVATAMRDAAAAPAAVIGDVYVGGEANYTGFTTISGFAVDGGSLTELPRSATPGRSGPNASASSSPSRLRT